MSVTPNLGLPLPDVNNLQTFDIGKLREALTTIDGVLPAKADLVGGKIPAGQLPAYVDDVVEFANFAALPATGVSGIIYVTTDTTPVRQWRWSGSAYAEIAPAYVLPKSTPVVLGGIKVGSGLVIDPGGTMSVAGGGPGSGLPVYGDVVMIATAGQTVFAVSGGYAPGQLDIYHNGVFLAGNGDDFSAANGTTVTLTAGASAGDTMIFRRWIYLPEAQAVNKNGDTLVGALNFAPFTSVASATTVNIGLATSNHVTITGTTTITGFGTAASGVERTLAFAGALTLTHNAASLILPGGANIIAAAGDVAEFVSLGGGNWRCSMYQKANGQAVVSPTMPTPQSLNRGAFVAVNTSGGALVSNTRYGVWTGAGAITVTAPSFANSVPGDEIVIGQVADSWRYNAFTVNFTANVMFFNSSGGGDTQLICNTSNPQGFRLYCAWKDSTNAYWVLA